MITAERQKKMDEVSRYNQIRDARACGACGGIKAKGYPLCMACLHALPEDIRRALYQPDRCGFAEPYRVSLNFIKEHGNGKSTDQRREREIS